MFDAPQARPALSPDQDRVIRTASQRKRGQSTLETKGVLPAIDHRPNRDQVTPCRRAMHCLADRLMELDPQRVSKRRAALQRGQAVTGTNTQPAQAPANSLQISERRKAECIDMNSEREPRVPPPLHFGLGIRKHSINMDTRMSRFDPWIGHARLGQSASRTDRSHAYPRSADKMVLTNTSC